MSLSTQLANISTPPPYFPCSLEVKEMLSSHLIRCLLYLVSGPTAPPEACGRSAPAVQSTSISRGAAQVECGGPLSENHLPGVQPARPHHHAQGLSACHHLQKVPPTPGEGERSPYHKMQSFLATGTQLDSALMSSHCSTVPMPKELKEYSKE